MKQTHIAVVVVNWNGEEDSLRCIELLKNQTLKAQIIAVDNGSSDGFANKVKDDTEVTLLQNEENLGFSGGVNTGIRHAIKNGYEWVGLINNDAAPGKKWIEELVNSAEVNSDVGISTGKLLKTDGAIDSTGDQYSTWGLAYPRGRDEKDDSQYEDVQEVFGATGGASLYRVEMLKEIGLFDEDFFAYYEDVDISFRAQLAGWKVMYTPKAIAHHKVGASSSKIPGFTTYMTIKNLPWLYWKNMPLSLVPKTLPRFTIAYWSIVFSSLAKGKIVPTIKGLYVSTVLSPKKLVQRYKIQRYKKATNDYVDSILIHDLPPNATKLHKLRSFFRKVLGRPNNQAT